jgi:hypothetical protein
MPVVVAQRWWHHRDLITLASGEKVDFQTDEEFIRFISDKVLQLHDALNGRTLVIIGGVPETSSRGGILTCLSRPQLLPNNCADRIATAKDRQPLIVQVNAALKAISQDLEAVSFIDPFEVFCDGSRCFPMIDGKILYSDSNHLSKDGARLFAEVAGQQLWSAVWPADKQTLPTEDLADSG